MPNMPHCQQSVNLVCSLSQVKDSDVKLLHTCYHMPLCRQYGRLWTIIILKRLCSAAKRKRESTLRHEIRYYHNACFKVPLGMLALHIVQAHPFLTPRCSSPSVLVSIPLTNPSFPFIFPYSSATWLACLQHTAPSF
jgi:hypothetical protein